MTRRPSCARGPGNALCPRSAVAPTKLTLGNDEPLLSHASRLGAEQCVAVDWAFKDCAIARYTLTFTNLVMLWVYGMSNLVRIGTVLLPSIIIILLTLYKISMTLPILMTAIPAVLTITPQLCITQFTVELLKRIQTGIHCRPLD